MQFHCYSDCRVVSWLLLVYKNQSTIQFVIRLTYLLHKYLYKTVYMMGCIIENSNTMMKSNSVQFWPSKAILLEVSTNSTELRTIIHLFQCIWHIHIWYSTEVSIISIRNLVIDISAPHTAVFQWLYSNTLGRPCDNFCFKYSEVWRLNSVLL